MIELYLLATLAGLGYILNKKQVKDTFAPTGFNKRDIPSSEDTYQSQHLVDVWRQEQKKSDKYYKDSLNPKETNVIHRAHTDIKGEEDQGHNFKSKLTGVEIPNEEFVHNNMIPFFGSHVRQNVQDKSTENFLAHKTGTDRTYFMKEEVPNVFSDVRNSSQVPFGTQNNADFRQSRMTSPPWRFNEKPIEEVRVGPGLGKDYTSMPSGGFQQALGQDAVMPYTVDELRVLTNPKISFEGRTVDGMLPGGLRGDVGEVNKNRVNTFYKNNPDRYFVTAGENQTDRVRPGIIFKDTNRLDTTVEYTGTGYNPETGTGVRVIPDQKETFRQQFSDTGLRNVENSMRHGQADDEDFGKDNYVVLSQERDTQQTPDKYQWNNLQSVVKSIITPILDVVRPTTKEYLTQSSRASGAVLTPTDFKKRLLYAPDDRPRVTIKEQTHVKNYKGGAGAVDRANSNRQQYWNADINDTRESILEDREPTVNNVKTWNGKDTVTPSYWKKQMDNEVAARTTYNPKSNTNHNLAYTHWDSTNERNWYKEDNRETDAVLLDQLKANPYAIESYFYSREDPKKVSHEDQLIGPVTLK